jgi:hypothetical protein
MAKPLYVQAFEHFKNNHDDPLKAYVAFGLYIDAECKWAATQPSWPTGAKYKKWFECSIPHSTDAHNERATVVLLEFANNIVEQKRANFLEAAIEAYKEEAAKSEKGFWRGVAEALTGALLWTLVLIAAAFILQWFSPDIYEVLGRVLGKH